MTADQVQPSAPPLLPPSSSAGGGSINSHDRRRRSSTTEVDGDGDAGARRSRPGNSAGGQQQRRRNNNNNDKDSRGSNSSRRQPPVELAMPFHTVTDQPLPPPPPISATSSSSSSSSSSRRLQASASASASSTRRAPSSVGTNQPLPQSQSGSQGQTKITKKRSSQTLEGMETTAANASLSQLVAEANATEAELERRRSRLAEIRQRSDAHCYELTIQEEAKKIRRLQKAQRKLKERMMRMQQRQHNLDDAEAPLDFSGGVSTAKQRMKTNRTASRTGANVATAAAVVGRGSGSIDSEEAIVRRSSSRMTTDSSGTGITNDSSKRSKNRNKATARNQSTQSQQQKQNSATIAAVSAAAATSANGSARSSMAADEALARKLQNEMLKEQEAVRAMEQQFQDEEMARSLAAAEAARMSSLGLSPNDMLDDGNSGRRRSSSRGGGCCNTVHRMISFVIMAGCVGVVLFVLFGIVFQTAGGDPNSLPPWFRDSWGQGWEGDYGGQNANSSDFQRWRIGRNKKGLKLTLINGLSDDWHNHFYQAIEDWNEAPALQLTIVPDMDGPPCEKHTRGMVKTCNGNYGQTDWTGLNELLFENNWIVSSVAMMNENYLRNARDTERQYVMCHELGHAWGLPHRDEVVGNRDLGTCLDYTITPQNNMKPDEIDFSNLQDMYGEVNAGRRRRLRLAVPTPVGDDTEVLHVSQYANTTQTKMAFSAAQSNRSRRQRARVLLHKTDHMEVWEQDVGEGRRLVTTMLLSQWK